MITVLGINHTNSRADVKEVCCIISKYDAIFLEADMKRYRIWTQKPYLFLTSPISLLQHIVMMTGGILKIPFITILEKAKREHVKVYLIDKIETEKISIRYIQTEMQKPYSDLVHGRSSKMAANIIRAVKPRTNYLVVVGGLHSRDIYFILQKAELDVMHHQTKSAKRAMWIWDWINKRR